MDECLLTTQISACLQEHVGLMSISSWTRSFSSSPRTWLNFFMKSWAFPASGRFSVNMKQSYISMSVTSSVVEGTAGCAGCLLAMLISFPNMAVLLASDYQGKERETFASEHTEEAISFVLSVGVCQLTTGSLWRSSSSLTRLLSMFWHFHISFRALKTNTREAGERRQKHERRSIFCPWDNVLYIYYCLFSWSM